MAWDLTTVPANCSTCKWGDGSFIPIYLHDLELQIGRETIVAKVGFSERLGVGFNLLGRKDVFQRFKICFQDSQGLLTFEPEPYVA
jgi:hypothetical protein